MIDMYAVHTLDLINYLVMKGNKILKIEDDRTDPEGKRKVCLFRECDKLHIDMDDYMLKKAQNSLKSYRKRNKQDGKHQIDN